jgi:hypothetical protein
MEKTFLKLLILFAMGLLTNLLSAQGNARYTPDSPDDTRGKRGCLVETAYGVLVGTATGAGGAAAVVAVATTTPAAPAVVTGVVGAGVVGGVVGGMNAYQDCQRSNPEPATRTVTVSYPGGMDTYTVPVGNGGSEGGGSGSGGGGGGGYSPKTPSAKPKKN